MLRNSAVVLCFASSMLLLLGTGAAETLQNEDIRNARASESLGLPFVDASYLFALEYALAAISALYILNFLIGWQANSSLATKASVILNQVLEPQFAHLGINENAGAMAGDGPADYIYYASGRRYCTGITVWMELQNRQDLFARVLRLFQPAMNDRCVITVPLSEDFRMEPMACFLVKPAELKRLKAAGERASACVKAVEDMAGEVRPFQELPGKFYVLGDNEGVISSVFSESICAKIQPFARLVHSIQVTDSGTGWDVVSESAGRRYVRAVFDMRAGNLDVVLKELVGVVLTLVDASASVKLSEASRAKAAALRKKIADEREKERLAAAREEASLRKAEEKRASEEAKMEAMKGSAAKQAKFEEKKRRKEMKQRMKKAVKK